MKAFPQALYKNKYIKALEWSKLISITGSAQILIQAIGFISGIIVIRLLSTQEYALYTLANTILGTMLILADGGIAAGVTAQSGIDWKDKKHLGRVIVTGMNLKRNFAIGSFILAIPVLLYLLTTHNASYQMSFIILISLIPAFYSTLTGSLLEIPLKLNQDIIPLQINQVGVNLGRLGITLSTLIFFPFAFIAIFASGLPQIWSNLRLRKLSHQYVDWKQKEEVLIRTKISKTVKRILPSAVYYCLSGQLTIWLISFLGTTTEIAQIGAIGRLAVIISIFQSLFFTLVIPRFVRLPKKRKILFSKFNKIQLGLIILSILLITTVWLFSTQALLILGAAYNGLEYELLLIIIGGCINLIGAVTYSLNTNRGWVINPIIGISIGITGIFIGLVTIDVSSLVGVLYFNIFLGIIGLLTQQIFCYKQINSFD